MRAALTIDDRLAQPLKDLAHRSGKSFKEAVNETLRRGLTAAEALPAAKPYASPSYSMGSVEAGIELDKALALAERL